MHPEYVAGIIAVCVRSAKRYELLSDETRVPATFVFTTLVMLAVAGSRLQLNE